MRFALAACALVALSACVTHTVTVLVPAADVPPKTPVVAAVTPGQVTDFPEGATVAKRGVVARDGKVLARLAPNDLLVMHAQGGETFGSISVRRNPMYELVSLAGVLAIIGGTVSAWGGAGACSNSQGLAVFSGPCLAIGLGGMAAAFAIGSTLLAWGIHGEIRVTDTNDTKKPAVTFAPNGLRVVF